MLMGFDIDSCTVGFDGQVQIILLFFVSITFFSCFFFNPLFIFMLTLPIVVAAVTFLCRGPGHYLVLAVQLISATI